MKQSKLFLIPILLILSLFFVQAISYNFPSDNNFLNFQTNNSAIGLGNFNNTHYLVNINGSFRKINISSLADEGIFSFAVINTATSIYKLPSNQTLVQSPTSTSTYTNTGVLQLSTGSTGKLQVSSYNSTDYYYYYFFSGSALYRVYYTTSATLGLNCMSTLQNELVNNYGLNITSFDITIQDNLERWFFNISDRWFFIDDSATTNHSNCNMIVEEATINMVNQSSGYKSIIINSELLKNVKDSSNYTSLYTSSNVDIYAGLVYYNGFYYDASSTCFDGYFFTNTTGSYQCNNFLTGGYCKNQSSLVLCTGMCSYTSLTNIYGVNYKSGVCTQSACVNDCNVLGQITSPSVNTLQECGFFDTDGCLDYEITYCSANEYSYNGQCKPLNYTQNPIYKINFDVKPYTSINIKGGLLGCPDINCTFDNNGVWNCPEDTCNKVEAINKNLFKVNFDEVNNILDVKTRTDLGGSGIFTLDLNVQGGNASNIIGVDCDYKSTKTNDVITYNQVVNGLSTRLINTTETYTTTINPLGFISHNTITLVTNSQSVELNLKSLDSKVLSDLWINVNTTTKELVVRNINSTGTLLFNDVYTSVNGLKKIVIETYFDSVNLEQNTMITLRDVTEAVILNKGVVMQQFENTSAIAPFNIVLTPVLNVNLLSIERETYNTNPLKYANLYTAGVRDFFTKYEDVGCSYLKDGSYTARVYLSEEFLGQFFSYKDIIINKETIVGNGLIDTTNDKGLTDGFTKTTKIIFSFVLSFIVAIILLILGLIDRNEQQGNYFKYLAVFLFFGGIIIFGIIGWLPVWIIISCFLLSASVVGFFIINKSQGG